MAGKTFRFDPYDLRKFKPYDIKTVVDIGAAIGTLSIMARILQPSSRVVAFEPSKETHERLCRNTKNWAVECYQIALGNGGPLHYKAGNFFGEHKFVKDGDGYLVESMTLSMLFSEKNIDPGKPYIVKIDCEGGEESLVHDSEAHGILSNAAQFMIEFHPSLFEDKAAVNEWALSFEDTHYCSQVIWEKIEGKKVRNLLVPVTKDFKLGRNHKTLIYISHEWNAKRFRQAERLLD